MREKRITAVILSVFMVLSLLPSTVFAAAAGCRTGGTTENQRNSGGGKYSES